MAEDIHVIPITETKPKNGELPPKESLEIEGFDLFMSKHYDDPDTRGVVVYVKSGLNASHLDIEECSFKDSIWLKIPTSDQDLLLGCIYRSGSPNKAIPLDDSLHKMIKHMTLHAGYKNILIVGDFNHPGITWNPDPVITTIQTIQKTCLSTV